MLVEGSTVKGAGAKRSVRIPRDYRTVDVTGKTVMPGLFDCHVHISYMTKGIE